MDLEEFKKRAFRVVRAGGKDELLAVEAEKDLAFQPPDKFDLVDVERTIETVEEWFDRKYRTVMRDVKTEVIKDKSKSYDFVNPEKGHSHGGTVAVKKGDFILWDGQGFFGCKGKNSDGKDVFSVLFTRVS